ncbi:AAA family ATPase [Aquabacterium sp.]|uniref:AAA family ATPase n=1 Tax=Aquabacterium sp. TaxID=1872578 RepID=UPI003CFD9D0E
MKIRQLFLKAFGPFTDATLDFSGPARIHLIYGPNEAGKSSALRALGDLRYGIHARSTDDFIHAFKDMLLAGTFEDAAGQVHALARRKGTKNTLMLADPATGLPIANSTVPPDVQLALTGGVQREQFETMYGLNSAHLREGGQQLIRGEGELGAALFEASTGSAGIKALQGLLEADAKRYFLARGRNALLNQAADELDEARKRYKQAITKPDQWKALKRAHDEAVQQVQTLREQLARHRRRQNEVTELRAVAPLIRELDRLEAEWATVEADVQLPHDGRERRLAAQQQQAQARRDLADSLAREALCQQALSGLVVEPALLREGAAVERLQANLAQVRRDRDRLARLRATVEEGAHGLWGQMRRLLPESLHTLSIDDGVAHMPSQADQTAWRAAASESLDQARDLVGARQQLETARRKLTQLNDQWRAQSLEVPDAVLQATLSERLQRAQALGDVSQRIATLEQAHRTAQRQLERDVEALGLSTVAQLATVRGLSLVDIDAHERAHAELRQELAALMARRESTEGDLRVQTERHHKLSAVGEVVSADTLRQARAQRDTLWLGVRAVLEEGAETDPDRATLSQRYAQASTEADRQADLLREGAQRAAEMAECTQRMTDMQQTLNGLLAAEEGLQSSLADLESRWQVRLSEQGLPLMGTGAAREWLTLRQSALTQRDRVSELGDELAQCRAQEREAAVELAAAVQALLPSAHPAHHAGQALGAWISQAQQLERDLVARHAAAVQHTQALQTLQREIAEAEHTERALLSAAQPVRERLQDACTRLHLPADATPEVINARLAEWQDWGEAHRRHAEQALQLKQGQAVEQAVVDEAQALAALLGEALGTHLDAWVDGVVDRLQASRETHRQQAELTRQVQDEARRRARIQSDLDAAITELAALVQQAGVSTEDGLVDAEVRSEHRRAMADRLQHQRSQLAGASEKDLSALRQQLLDQDSLALDVERQTLTDEIQRLEGLEQAAISAEHLAASNLAAIDTSDEAARAREEMESALARYRSGVRPWAQLKLAEALLSEVLKRHREKAQGPVVALAGRYFEMMTAGRFVRLVVDADGDKPMLLAQPAQGQPVGIAGLSEGTADQLYLALRLAALEVQRTPDRLMPLVLDDVLMTADDQRAACMLQALEAFSAGGQVLLFSHHQHLTDIARCVLGGDVLQVHSL